MVKKELKRFLQEEEGAETVEIVIIIAVVVALAIIFRNQIINAVKSLISNTSGKISGFGE